MSDYDDFAYGPSGDSKKQWWVGVGFASWPLTYGLICMHRGKATMFGRGGNLELKGPEAFWWALAFVTLGLFIHFHYFWGLSQKLWNFSQRLKAGAMLLMLLSLGMTFYYVIYLRF